MDAFGVARWAWWLLALCWIANWNTEKCGGVAGVASRSATAPLEMIKIKAQVGGGLGGSLWATLRAVAARNGARGLWAGNAANCLRVFPHAGIACLTYSQLVKRFLGGQAGAGKPTRTKQFALRSLAGAGAGIAATLATFPLDTVRARMTLAGSGGEQATNNSMWRCARL